MAYVADTVEGTLLAAAAELESGEVLNLGAGSEATVNELVRTLLVKLGRPGHPVIHGPPRPGDVRRLLSDTSRARERIGYDPTTLLDVGLERTVAWYLRVSEAVEALP
jgi:UDP-glucose 4-epimerase